MHYHRTQTLSFKGNVMIGRMIEIAQNDRFLCIQRGCMHISHSKTKELIAQVALDDMDGLMISGHGIWLSANLMASLAQQGIVVVLSNNRYRPVGILLGVDNHSLQGQRMIAQHDANVSINKRLWQEIVQTKLAFQASLLYYHKSDIANSVKILIKNVKSGDPSNLEAQGAKNYWKGLIKTINPDFKRDQSANDPVNICLNYGYTVLRIAIAKHILASGLHTGWGLHHCHPNNTMPLADDLMEPFRAMVDAKVYALWQAGLLTPPNQADTSAAAQENIFNTLDPRVKKSLVDVVYTDILVANENKPMLNYFQNLSASLVKVYMGEGKNLIFPDVKQIDWHDFEHIAEEKPKTKALENKKIPL